MQNRLCTLHKIFTKSWDGVKPTKSSKKTRNSSWKGTLRLGGENLQFIHVKKEVTQKSQRKRRMEITIKLEITESKQEKKISGTLELPGFFLVIDLSVLLPPPPHTTPPTLARGWGHDPGRPSISSTALALAIGSQTACDTTKLIKIPFSSVFP